MVKFEDPDSTLRTSYHDPALPYALHTLTLPYPTLRASYPDPTLLYPAG